MTTPILKTFVDKEALAIFYVKRLTSINKTTFLFSWPANVAPTSSLKQLAKEIARPSDDSKLDSMTHIRIKLYNNGFYMCPMNSRILRCLVGINAYGPIVSISANYTPFEFIKSLTGIIPKDMYPLSFYTENTYYPSYPAFEKKAQLLHKVKTNFSYIITKSVRTDTILIRNLVSYQGLIIKNTIRLCIQNQKQQEHLHQTS